MPTHLPAADSHRPVTPPDSSSRDARSTVLRWRALGALCVALWLTGCAGQAPVPNAPRQGDDWARQQDDLMALDTWVVAGKVGLRTPEDSTSANLDWSQTPQNYRMLISGPFGTGRSVLEGRAGAVKLTTGDGTFEAASPEALMQQQLGWSLPISALDYWARGLPAPGSAFEETPDELGFPRVLRQSGWRIEYRDWTYAGDLWLPRRLVMTYDDVRATLVINEWRPGASSESS